MCLSSCRMIEIAKSMRLTLVKFPRTKAEDGPCEEHRQATLVLPLAKYDQSLERRKRKKMRWARIKKIKDHHKHTEFIFTFYRQIKVVNSEAYMFFCAYSSEWNVKQQSYDLSKNISKWAELGYWKIQAHLWTAHIAHCHFSITAGSYQVRCLVCFSISFNSLTF